jgi:ribose transport system substrate-binding protein
MSSNRHTLLTVSTAALAAMLLAACSPGTTDDDGASDSASPGDSSSPVADVAADVETAMQPRDSFEVPSDPVDPSALSGKTVYYIPLTAQVNIFHLNGNKIAEALDVADVGLTVCDGGANPSQVSGCFDQAIGADAAAIVADGIPYAMAGNSFDAARTAGIPVVMTNLLEDPEHPGDETLAYVVPPAVEMVQSVADWMIADADGQATVVLQRVTDNHSTVGMAEAAEQEFADRCPDCAVVVNEVSAANFPLVASSTSSAILSNPDTGYLFSLFEHFIQPSIGGIQQTPNAAQIKIAAASGTLAGLQQVAQDGQVNAEAAPNIPFQAWATADAIFRLAAGQEVPEYDISYRLFDRSNIGDIELTEEAEASGDWYGPTDYTDDFSVLWGRN